MFVDFIVFPLCRVLEIADCFTEHEPNKWKTSKTEVTVNACVQIDRQVTGSLRPVNHEGHIDYQGVQKSNQNTKEVKITIVVFPLCRIFEIGDCMPNTRQMNG